MSQRITVPYNSGLSLDALCEMDMVARLKGTQSPWGVMIGERLVSIETSEVVTLVYYGRDLYTELDVKAEYDVVGLRVGDILFNVQLEPSPISDLGVKKHRQVELQGIPFTIVVMAQAVVSVGNIVITHYSLDRSLTYDAALAYYPNYVPIVASRITFPPSSSERRYRDLAQKLTFPPSGKIGATQQRLLDPLIGFSREEALSMDIALTLGLVGRKVLVSDDLLPAVGPAIVAVTRVSCERGSPGRAPASKIAKLAEKLQGRSEKSPGLKWDVIFSPTQPIPYEGAAAYVYLAEWIPDSPSPLINGGLSGLQNPQSNIDSLAEVVEEYYAMKLLELTSYPSIYGQASMEKYGEVSARLASGKVGADQEQRFSDLSTLETGQLGPVHQHILAGAAIRARLSLQDSPSKEATGSPEPPVPPKSTPVDIKQPAAKPRRARRKQ